MSVQAVTVVWQLRINENARIHNGSESTSLYEFFGNDISIAGYRVRLINDSSYLDFVYPGFGNEPGEFGVNFYDENYGRFLPANQLSLGENPNYNSLIAVELGIFDSDDNFVYIGETAVYTLSEVGFGHNYDQGTLLPPVTDWVVTDFYTDYPVPEPSITILAILGACALLLKRKNYERA